jgi:hypothetical protein
MKITVDTDFNDDTVIIVPEQFLTEDQIRELQNVLEEKQLVVLPAGRILRT